MVNTSVKELLNLQNCNVQGDVQCDGVHAVVVYDCMNKGCAYYRKYLVFHRNGEIEGVVESDYRATRHSIHKLTSKNTDAVFKALGETIQSVPVPTWYRFKENPECYGGGYWCRCHDDWDSGKYLLRMQQALFRLMAKVRKSSNMKEI